LQHIPNEGEVINLDEVDEDTMRVTNLVIAMMMMMMILCDVGSTTKLFQNLLFQILSYLKSQISILKISDFFRFHF
jgi:small-conductance mechanosensitive channel